MHVVATAGHVDHGKSTLVKALTGIDPDRFAEEKRRGLTIDLGFATTVLPSGTAHSIIDVPGHIRFIKNMLAGVGTVDACIFVVAATEGWKPQSEEHLRILEMLDIRHGLVALTKVGIADEELLEIAHLEIKDRLADTFLDSAQIVNVDALQQIGLEELRSALDKLLATTPVSIDSLRPRLWIDRTFAAKGSGTIVTGTLSGGTLRVHDELVLHPHNQKVRVRALQNHQKSYEELPPGSRCAINIAGISHDKVSRGHVLVKAKQWHLTKVIDANLQVLDNLDHGVSRRGAYTIYIGSGEYSINLRILGKIPLQPGATGPVRIFLPEALPLLPGDRFVLRESGRSETIGGGEILDVDPQKPAAQARPDKSTNRIISERGWTTVDELERLTGERRKPNLGTWITDPEWLKDSVASLEALLKEAGPLGLDLARLDEMERAIAALIDNSEIKNGYLKLIGADDPLANHPFVKSLSTHPFAPPEPHNVEKNELRELIKRGDLIEQDGIFFAASAISAAAHLAATLLAQHPNGFTVSMFREAAANTRKHALPLLTCLDNTGVTRRRGDLRIGGPRLPNTTET